VAESGEPNLFRKTELKGGYAPSDDFTTDQAWATSADGTRVPYFIIHRTGVAKPGDAATLLYGYGGFNISLEPGFSLARLCWLLAYGGVAVVANLRGGGEFGVDWRNAGSSRHKQNVFNDFQAVAESLISDGWTRPGRIAIQGGSNGGLLVAACVNQRPDLYAAALAQVGVMDMLRFHKFTIGHAWQTDYGYVDNPDDFRVLHSYSPLHNVRAPGGGTGQYPAIMLTTGDHDDRVVPLHSHKLTATLQHELAGKDPAGSVQCNPLVTRIQVRAGHGAGKPTELVIAEVSDMYAFAAKAMGAAWAADPKLMATAAAAKA
jgi:prolyl oligopeptidase